MLYNYLLNEETFSPFSPTKSVVLQTQINAINVKAKNIDEAIQSL